MNWKQFFGIAGLSAGLALNAFGARPYDHDKAVTPRIEAVAHSRQALFELYNQHRTDGSFGQVWIAPFEELDNLATSAYHMKNGFTRHDAVVRVMKQIDESRSKLKDTRLANDMRKLIPAFVQGQLAVINQSTGSKLTYNP